MNIKVNGEEKQLDQENVKVSELLEIFNVEMPDMVSVQVNGEFVKREEFGQKDVKDSDEIDFLYFMGGGVLKG